MVRPIVQAVPDTRRACLPFFSPTTTLSVELGLLFVLHKYWSGDFMAQKIRKLD
ncbi:hypothetical protein RGR602_PC00482 (plasmid) [Rhizobium gallicum bv. gallicum R602sp]|uniref:Uncharacterized protein n=1 Tax=Rhizobium gallicum bv. gallicum R602sp TaxID=1041138 RepID=A0A0B4XDD0_9HYPH|nr:hypothetical protein RGR602_PC00482 [Rhizobium gallicum bv. gallicum R602sp]